MTMTQATRTDNYPTRLTQRRELVERVDPTVWSTAAMTASW